MWIFRFSILVLLLAGFFKDIIARTIFFELSLTVVTWPAFILSLLIGKPNFLINEGPEHIYLSRFGVLVFYGGLLCLTFIVPYFYQKK